MFQKYVLLQKQNILGSICDLITYPSISEESSNPLFPFGKACHDSLKYFLHLANSLGFHTKNVDGYCGFAEFGQGDELVGIIGHLDVVPAKEDDWTYPPFVPTIAHNRIYGRGSMDDKGPVISALYAMKIVMDYCKENNITLQKRIRLIVGLNEEKDWKCINYYKEHEEIPNLGFSPDADFPCIHAEKSVLSLALSEVLPSPSSKSFFQKTFSTKLIHIDIEEINDEHNAINIVPKFCSLVLKISDRNFMPNLITSCKTIIDQLDYEIDVYKVDDFHLKLTSYGISSHSAHPELGKNAISHLLLVLNRLFEQWKQTYPLISNFAKWIGNDFLGKAMKLDSTDESGVLTLTPSQFYQKDGKLCIGINLRIPIKTEISKIVSTFENCFGKQTVSTLSSMDSLYLPKEDSLVQTLCHIFNDTCHTNFSPIAIGGATYARAFPNCVSFGMNFPGDKDMCHQVDECIDIDKLMLATNIYAKAIYELSK